MAFWTLFALSVGISGSLGFQYCYECSSKSALCRESVYDGHYLSKTPCKSPCFYRIQDNRIYRGCFDGWVGGIVDNSYLGCRVQEYLGEKVEWCFCNGTNNDERNPCNGADHETIANLVSQEVEENTKEEEYEDDENEIELYSNDKFFFPNYRQPEGRQARITEGNDIDAEPIYEDAGEELGYERPRYDFEYVSSICHGRYDGTYQDVTDCSRYFHCTNGRPYRMRCPEGTLWNDGLKTCTFNLDPERPNPCAIPETFNYYVGYGARIVKPFLLERTEQQEILNDSPPND